MSASWREDVQAKVSGSGQLQMKQVATGGSHTCAIASDNKAYCWGAGANGQLGNGTTAASQTTPVAVSQGAMPAGATIRQIATGNSHTCAIASDNKAYCWGLGTNGRLGDGATNDQSTPVAVSQGAMPAGATIRQITAGSTSTCAIASDNKAYCWGANNFGQLGRGNTSPSTTPVAVVQGAMPAGATIRQIMASSAGTSTCAIASDNKAYCWGQGTSGQLGDGGTTTQNSAVAVSQGAMPAGATIRQIAVGGTHACAIASDNKAYCWGTGTNGRLGNGDTSQQSAPVAVVQGAMPAGSTINQITAGGSHACVEVSNNQAYCWGQGQNGRLGNGSATDQASPVATSQGARPAGATVLQISAGSAHVCAVASNNQAYCWGQGTSGRLGNGSAPTSQTTPVAVSAIAPMVEVAQSVHRAYGPSASTSPGSPLAGDNNTAALSSIAGDFRLRIGLTNLEADSGLTTEFITAGTSYACIIASDNKVYCWGSGSDGRLGNGGFSNQTTPAIVSQGAMPAGATIRQIATGNAHSCAIASDNKAYCWGSGANGRLGDGSTTVRTTPVAVSQGAMPAGATVRQISVGNNHSCAIASDNKAYCWGSGANGRLGNGSVDNQTTPVAVSQGAMPTGATILQVAVGDSFTCAIASDNKAYCWGLGNSGRLGTGDTSQQTTPAAVSQGAIPAGLTIRHISTGDTHACVVASDNKAYCWGLGNNGRLGNGTSTTSPSPVAVSQGAMPAGATIFQVAAGAMHTCAIASNARPYCWGNGTDGRLGNGATPMQQTTPVAVSQGQLPSGLGVYDIVTATTNTCAIASDNQSYCWGDNTNGQVGDTTTTQRTTPTAVSQGAMTDTGSTISSSQLNLNLQAAPLGVAASCSVVASGWANVTTTSAMNWGAAPPSHNTAISAFGSDPAAPTGSGYVYQRIVQSGSFTNNNPIAPQETGLWDFVLHDRSSSSATDYCFRLVSNTAGTSIDTYGEYPRVTTAVGSLGVQFVDSGGTPLAGPATNTPFTPLMSGSSAQESVGELLLASGKLLEIHNSSTNSGWSVSLAATGGPFAQWQSDSDSYAYNAASSGDGQLTVVMTSLSKQAQGSDPTGAACTTANLSDGVSGTFSNTVSSITLLSGSPTAQFNCTWRLSDISLSQTIPANQGSGSYSLDMTITIVAN